MELLWKHLTEVLAQDRHFDGSKIDQDRLAKLFEAYQYAKLMDDKLNPVPVGVQALEQDNHLKLPATYSRVLLDSLKAAEKEQKGWESNLIPAVTENLKGRRKDNDNMNIYI
uniref:Uncharacterized protein n=1 Tax=Lotharella globosa TaxID=91324 RepID=A0A7S4DUN9_9EUKA